MDQKLYKQKVINAFSESVSTYDQYADIQKLAAEKLIASLTPWLGIIPPGPVLEVGCGTGLITELMMPLFPQREVFVTDISSEMLHLCKSKLEKKGLVSDNIHFDILDGDELKEEKKYALIISGFSIQWFNDAMFGGYNMIDALKPDGLLLLSFPGSKSFFQWKNVCEDLDIPFTGSNLPEMDRLAVQFSMKPVLMDYYDEIYLQRYDNALQFFRSLKRTGEYVKKSSPLNAGQLRQVIKKIDSKSSSVIEMGYHLAYLAIRKLDPD